MAGAHHHYHWGARALTRSTLSDANARRPCAIFAETFADLAGLAIRKMRRDGQALIQLLDSSPIPLSTLHEARIWNGRIKGAKLHLVYDPDTDLPQKAALTPANINDITFAHDIEITSGATYVFDKGYCSLAFWRRVHAAGAIFVTRAKKNAALKIERALPFDGSARTQSNILKDEIVRHESKSNRDQNLAFPLRRVTVKRDDGKVMQIITNDLKRTATDIAALYKKRWRIGLVFRWIKQNLKIKRFIGRSQNAVKLQILATLIAYLLLRLAMQTARRHDIRPIRFTELIRASLLARIPIETIDKPPPKRSAANTPDPRQLTIPL